MSDESRIGRVNRVKADYAKFSRLNSPHYWMSHAEAMRRAAFTLKEKMDFELRRFRESRHADLLRHGGGPYVASSESIGEPWIVQHGRDHGPLLLIAGLATEAALKAIRVQRDPACVSNGESKLGHDQIRLAKDAGILLLENEHTLCRLLSDFVEFAGRYPSAMNAGKSHNAMTIGDDVFPEFQKLFDRLVGIYKSGTPR